MGLDNVLTECLNMFVNIKLLLAQLGLGAKRVLGFQDRSRMSPLTRDRKTFEEEVRGQFLKLNEKGLSISIFTL